MPRIFWGGRFDIILCMSRFNHVLSGDSLCQGAVSSYFFILHDCSLLSVALVLVCSLGNIFLGESSRKKGKFVRLRILIFSTIFLSKLNLEEFHKLS